MYTREWLGWFSDKEGTIDYPEERKNIISKNMVNAISFFLFLSFLLFNR